MLHMESCENTYTLRKRKARPVAPVNLYKTQHVSLTAFNIQLLYSMFQPHSTSITLLLYFVFSVGI